MNESEKCQICKNDVRLMCQKGTRVCSQKCDKKRDERLFAIAA